MLRLIYVPASRSAERLRTGAGPRSLAIGLAVLIEGLLLLVMLSLGVGQPPGKEQDRMTVVNVAPDISEPLADPVPPERQRAAENPPQPEPERAAEPVPQPVEPAPLPPPRPTLSTPIQRPPSTNIPRRPARPAGPLYGPPDRGRPAFLRDTERVGTAPNGQPLYAAAWYREPREEMLRDYLSTAQGPGWGLIACRTAPDYRVEDCIGLAEYPEGSQINRAILAAAWEFKVRPPRLGGQTLVGSWVRIRIDWQRR